MMLLDFFYSASFILLYVNFYLETVCNFFLQEYYINCKSDKIKFSVLKFLKDVV